MQVSKIPHRYVSKHRCWKNQVAFSFSLYCGEGRDEKGEVLIPKTAGTTAMDSELNYELGQFRSLPASGRYELRLKTKLAPGAEAARGARQVQEFSAAGKEEA